MIGTVTDVAFRGGSCEHSVELAEESEVTGVFDDARLARGDTVGLMIEPAGCMAFPVRCMAFGVLDPFASETPEDGSGQEVGVSVRAQDLGALAVAR